MGPALVGVPAFGRPAREPPATRATTSPSSSPSVGDRARHLGRGLLETRSTSEKYRSAGGRGDLGEDALLFEALTAQHFASTCRQAASPSAAPQVQNSISLPMPRDYATDAPHDSALRSQQNARVSAVRR